MLAAAAMTALDGDTGDIGDCLELRDILKFVLDSGEKGGWWLRVEAVISSKEPLRPIPKSLARCVIPLFVPNPAIERALLVLSKLFASCPRCSSNDSMLSLSGVVRCWDMV